MCVFTRRERGLALAQTAVKAGICNLLHFLLRVDPLTRGMHPPADTETACLCYRYIAIYSNRLVITILTYYQIL